MSRLTEREYLVALYSFLPFGPQRIKLLKTYFGSYKKAWCASKNILIEIGLRPTTVEKFLLHRAKFDVEKYFNQLKYLRIDYITMDDSNYPENLVDLDDAPCVLYVRGEITLADVNAVAIVGSRKMTAYGREVARKFSAELAGYGISIISGLAFGIDVAAHKACVDVGGRCIAVLASGVDQVTPRSNEWLAAEIIKKGGAIISEFPPGIMPQRSFFPHRNRIISGLSKAVIVIEGMEKSGTLHTASHAANQGRQVFAVPGQITSPMSGAPHFLIKNGAKMAICANDILEELDLQLKVDKEAIEKVMPADNKEAKLLKIITNEPLHLDEIARISTLPVSDISAKLTIMELKGLVKNVGGGVYRKI